MALRTARAEGRPINAPTKTWPSLNADMAFKIQQINSEQAIQYGDRLVGYKLGNIAKVMQAAFGLDHLDYGFLHASSFIYDDFPKQIHQTFISAIDYAIPAIEIIDSRVKDWAIDLPDTLADNGSTSAVIIGGTPRKLTDLTLSNTRGSLQFKGEEVMSGNTKNILGNPLSAVAWLVNKLAEYDIEFKAGQLIMPGSCLEAVPMDKPGKWTCTYKGWGTIEFDVL
ncbi:2-keto-4-pentenoate hydratase [Aspergillus foveolatus]|uniref:2-keto-4-pentenoate hydratase n=1 Tax=Aspergillus foveolatus TaxID=210207 RepID=UPI003CCCB53A